MSQSSSDSGNNRSGGQRRSGGRRRNRSNRGGNRGGNRNRNRGGQQGGRRSGSGPRKRPEPAPLTFWQKLLKAIGLYDPDKKPKRSMPSRVPQPPAQQGSQGKQQASGGAKRKSRTRNARTAQKPVDTNRLYVGNLSFDASEADIEELFKGIGPVGSVELVYNRNTQRSKGYGFVEMGSVEDAKRAVETLHDKPFMERQLIVSGAKSKGPNEGRGGGRKAAEEVSDITPPEEDLVDERLGPEEPREII